MAQSGSESKRAAGDWGREAEQLAADYLLARGYTIRERNWKIEGCVEVDIIAQTGDNIVLVEVKARSGKHTQPLDAVDTAKMHRLVKAADIYIGSLAQPFYYRFDIIGITGNRKDYKLEHYPNAFLSPLRGSR